MGRYRKKPKAFNFAPFSKKQKMLINWWRPRSPFSENDYIIADGSIRSGKTIACIIGFLMWSQEEFSGESFVLAGKTMGALKKNVIRPMQQILEAWNWPYVYTRSGTDARIEIGSNTYYLYGANTEASQDTLQGLTAAGAYADEAALFPQSFIDQMIGRCSVDGWKVWMNCNPEGPESYIYAEFIKKSKEKRVCRLHFTMNDNLTLSARRKEAYQRTWSVGSVFYKRFILGLWTVAEGLLFRYFAENDEPYLIDDTDIFDSKGNLKIHFTKLVIGIDFGGNGSKTSLYCTGYQNGYKSLIVLEENDLPLTQDIDANAICDKFIEFYKMIIRNYGHVDLIQPDSASSTLIYSLINAAKSNKLPYRNITGVKKNEIADRPKTIDLLLNTGRLKIHRKCKNLRKALSNLRWDEKKKDVPEDKNIGNINDDYDAFCYTWITYTSYIELEREI